MINILKHIKKDIVKSSFHGKSVKYTYLLINFNYELITFKIF